MNTMKAEGHRQARQYLKSMGREWTARFAHTLILDNKGRECEYTQGFLNEFNKASKKS